MTSARPTRANRTDNVADTRRRLLDAAIEQFTSNPYEDVTIAGIAAAAGVSHQTLLNHFESKEALAVAAAQLVVFALDRAARDAERLAELQQAASAWQASQSGRQRERRLHVQRALQTAGPILFTPRLRRATRDAPTTGRLAAKNSPPPSLRATTPSASCASTAATSSVIRLVMKRWRASVDRATSSGEGRQRFCS